MDIIHVRKSLTASNDALAKELRDRLAFYNIWVLNLISSPGAGKTSLVEKTIERFKSDYSITVIEGDPYTSLDSDRINRTGAKGIQINTKGGCHLDARMIGQALEKADLNSMDILIIENVGNLLCPAAWDLGQDETTVVTSLTEGPDKPLKYPEAFTRAGSLVINKMDLKPYVPTSCEMLKPNALGINPLLTVFETSCTDGLGLVDWFVWIKRQTEQKKAGEAAHA